MIVKGAADAILLPVDTLFQVAVELSLLVAPAAGVDPRDCADLDAEDAVFGRESSWYNFGFLSACL
tara:strand:- start:54 stop:251 length:198 start_codon:yes stop_codon:yes gene_type:complete